MYLQDQELATHESNINIFVTIVRATVIYYGLQYIFFPVLAYYFSSDFHEISHLDTWTRWETLGMQIFLIANIEALAIMVTSSYDILSLFRNMSKVCIDDQSIVLSGVYLFRISVATSNIMIFLFSFIAKLLKRKHKLYQIKYTSQIFFWLRLTNKEIHRFK